MDVDRARRDSHGLKSLEILNALKDDSALEEKQHAELHQTEVPVVVEEPQASREELEHKEGANHMLFV